MLCSCQIFLLLLSFFDCLFSDFLCSWTVAGGFFCYKHSGWCDQFRDQVFQFFPVYAKLSQNLTCSSLLLIKKSYQYMFCPNI